MGWALPTVLLEPWRGHNVGQVAGGFAALLASLVSLYHIGSHLRHNHTLLRKCTVRILLVVPIFATESSAALMLQASRNNWPMILTYVRDLYESVAMFSFMQFVLTFLGGPRKLTEKLTERAHGKSGKVQHIWPLNKFLRDLDCGVDFVAWTMYGIFQYVAVCITLFVANFCLWCWINSISGGEEMPMPHLQIGGIRVTLTVALRGVLDGTKAVSCAFALYNLALFYHETMDLLHAVKPLYKFFSIKGVIFFTFWQGVGITLAGRAGIVPGDEGKVILANLTWTNGTNVLNDTAGGAELHGHEFVWTHMEVAEGLKNFLLCFEMLFFAVLHRWAYPYDELHHGELQTFQYRFAEGPGSYRAVGTVSPVKASCDTQSDKVGQLLAGEEVVVLQVGFHRPFQEFNYEVQGAAGGLEACNGIYKPSGGTTAEGWHNGRPVYRNVKSTSGALFFDGKSWRLATEPVAGGQVKGGYVEAAAARGGEAPAAGSWPSDGSGATKGLKDLTVTERQITGPSVQMARLEYPAGWVVMHGVLEKADKVAEAVDFLDSVTLLREIRDINKEAKAARPRMNIGAYMHDMVSRSKSEPFVKSELLGEPMLSSRSAV